MSNRSQRPIRDIVTAYNYNTIPVRERPLKCQEVSQLLGIDYTIAHKLMRKYGKPVGGVCVLRRRELLELMESGRIKV